MCSVIARKGESVHVLEAHILSGVILPRIVNAFFRFSIKVVRLENVNHNIL